MQFWFEAVDEGFAVHCGRNPRFDYDGHAYWDYESWSFNTLGM